MDYTTLLQECESLKHYREISWNPKVHLPFTFFPGTDPPFRLQALQPSLPCTLLFSNTRGLGSNH